MSVMDITGGEFGVETPLINKKAIQYFLDRKFKIDSFTTLFMSNVPFGKFENHLCFSPEFLCENHLRRSSPDLNCEISSAIPRVDLTHRSEIQPLDGRLNSGNIF